MAAVPASLGKRKHAHAMNSDFSRSFAVVVHDVAPIFARQLVTICDALAPRVGDRVVRGCRPLLARSAAGPGNSRHPASPAHRARVRGDPPAWLHPPSGQIRLALVLLEAIQRAERLDGCQDPNSSGRWPRALAGSCRPRLPVSSPPPGRPVTRRRTSSPAADSSTWSRSTRSGSSGWRRFRWSPGPGTGASSHRWAALANGSATSTRAPPGCLALRRRSSDRRRSGLPAPMSPRHRPASATRPHAGPLFGASPRVASGTVPMIRSLHAMFHRRLRRRAERLTRRLVPHLPAGARLLDIGSGTGHNARALRVRTGGSCLEADVVDFHVVGGGTDAVRRNASSAP